MQEGVAAHGGAELGEASEARGVQLGVECAFERVVVVGEGVVQVVDV